MSDLETADVSGNPAAASVVDQPVPTWKLVLSGLGRDSMLQLGAVLVQFGLLSVVLWKYDLQNQRFLNLLALVWAGFTIQHFLPARLRMPFFSAVSLGGILLVLGPVSTLWVLGIGLGLIALAHLPVPYGLRVILLIAAAVGLGLLRVNPIHVPQLAPLWPVIGSMFMFRMIIYMYDLKHHSAPFSPSRSFAYFFMIPNIIFPLFPVVDYKTFCRTHYSGEPLAIYQKGIEWIFRGIVHLLLYRLMYQNFMLPLEEVASAGDAAQYMVTTFLRYLKVSGNFHIILGILCLFGFNLPDVFNRYLLATSFTDFWRRINIYWKDFMQKVVLNPTYYMFKDRLGMTGSLLFATVVTFAVTWFLHGYQEYWLAGAFKFEAQDAIYWGFLGTVVVLNVYIENRFGRKRSLSSKAKRTIGEDIVLALRTCGMLIVLVAIWNVWSCDTIYELGPLVKHFATWSMPEALAVLLALGILGVVAVVAHRYPRHNALKGKPGEGPNPVAFWRSVTLRTLTMGVILVVAKWPLLLSPLSGEFSSAIMRLRDSSLNAQDLALLEKGYYEDLLVVTRFNPELAELYAARPADWNINPTIKHNEPGVYPPYELLPSMDVIYKGVRMTTNQWGMRDREYDKAKAPGTFRIAILGSSHVVGVGVLDDQTFENLLEDRLNREKVGGRITRFEILNFSISGYGPMSCLHTLENKILEFEPDLFLYAPIRDDNVLGTELANAVEKNLTVPFGPAREAIAEAGIDPETPRIVGERKIRPYVEDLLGPIYRRMVELCRERGIATAASFLPRPQDTSAEQEEIDHEIELARQAGFTMIDISSAFEGVEDLDGLLIAPWDFHPNAEGHQLLAKTMHDALMPVLDELIAKREARDR